MSKTPGFVFSPHNGGRPQASSCHPALTYCLLSVLQVGKQCKCLQNVSLIRDSASCRLTPPVGLGPLLPVLEALNFKSSIHCTALPQLKWVLDNEVCQRHVIGVSRKSVGVFFPFCVKSIDFFTHLFLYKTFAQFTQGNIFEELMLKVSFAYSSVPSHYC